LKLKRKLKGKVSVFVLILVIILPMFLIPSFEAFFGKFKSSTSEGYDVDDFLGSNGVQDLWVSSIELDRHTRNENGFFDSFGNSYYSGSDGWLVDGNFGDDSSVGFFVPSGSIVVSSGGSIQAAVDAASSGDTIFVMPGVYVEHVVVYKFNLTLVGADTRSTVIDGDGWGDVVKITNSSVTFSNFTVRNGDVGVKIEGIYAFNNTVSGNRIHANGHGVYLLNALGNTVTGNWIVSNSEVGIAVDGGGGNSVYNNYFSNKINAYDANGGQTWNKTYGSSDDEDARSIVQTSDGGYAIAGETNSFGASYDFWLVKTDANGNQLWNKTYGGSGDDYARSVIQTSDGGYVIAGYTNSFGASWDYDFWLVKTDAYGNHLWNRTYGGFDWYWNEPNWDEANCVVQTSDGGYILAGSTAPISTLVPKFWLVKTDANGNHMWNRTYGGQESGEASSVVQTSDGGYAIAGGGFANLIKTDANGIQQWAKTYGEVASSVVQTSDGGYALAGGGLLVKTDSAGNQLWSKTYGGSDLVQTSDGGYILAGRTSFGAGGYDFRLIKTDASGNYLWNKIFGGSNNDIARSVVETGDGGYAIAGVTHSFGAGGDFWLVKTYSPGGEWRKTFGGSGDDYARSVVQTSDGGYALAGYTNSFGAGGYDLWLVRTDAAGNQLWNKTFGGSGDDYAYSVVETSDGGFALAGYTYSFGAGLNDLWLVRTDAAGNQLWNKTFGGPAYDYAFSVIQTSDGGFALAGRTNSFGAGYQDFWLVKIDSTGSVQWHETYGGTNHDRAFSLVQTSRADQRRRIRPSRRHAFFWCWRLRFLAC